MKRIGITLLAMMIASPAWAGTLKVGVNGLVCAFCVKAIEEGFKKQPEIANVHVDLDNKRVTLTEKQGATIADIAIKETIADAGYNVTTITRGE